MVSPVFAGIAGGLVASIALVLALSSLARGRPGPGDVLWAKLSGREPSDVGAGGPALLFIYGVVAGVVFAWVGELAFDIDLLPLWAFVLYGLGFGVILWGLFVAAFSVGDVRERLRDTMQRDRRSIMGWLLAVHLVYGLVLGLAVFLA